MRPGPPPDMGSCAASRGHVQQVDKAHQLATNADRHLIQVPSSMRLGASGPQPAGDCRAEAEDPATDALVGDQDAALGQELLDISEAEGKAQVHPDRTLDDVRREAIARVREREHARQLRPRTGHRQGPNVTRPLAPRTARVPDTPVTNTSHLPFRINPVIAYMSLMPWTSCRARG